MRPSLTNSKEDLIAPGGKNASIDQPSPPQPDHLILLIDSSIRWSAKTDSRWSDDPFYPVYLNKLNSKPGVFLA